MQNGMSEWLVVDAVLFLHIAPVSQVELKNVENT